MQKRNKLSYETYLEVFQPIRDGEGGSWLKVRSGPEEFLVKIPTSVMYRLYRIGQAYGFRQLRYFESEKELLIGTYEITGLLKNLKGVLRLVNDDVLQKYVAELIHAVESTPNSPTKNIAVSVGNYFS